MASPSIRRVFYRSESLVAPNGVPAIIRSSRRNNERLSITGALVYTGARFGQLIEGGPDEIEALLQALRADPRHKNMEICFDEGSDTRWVEKWSMGYLTNAAFAAHISGLCGPDRGGAEGVAAFRELLDGSNSL